MTTLNNLFHFNFISKRFYPGPDKASRAVSHGKELIVKPPSTLLNTQKPIVPKSLNNATTLNNQTTQQTQTQPIHTEKLSQESISPTTSIENKIENINTKFSPFKIISEYIISPTKKLISQIDFEFKSNNSGRDVVPITPSFAPPENQTVTSFINDNSLDISTPNLPTPLLHAHPVSESINFNEELEQKSVEDNRRLIKKIQLLEKYKLWRFDSQTGEKLNKKVFELWNKKYSLTTEIHVSEEDFRNNPNINLGLLQIENIYDTVLLSGIQKHVAVVYCAVNGQQIIWGYLTSDKSEGNFIISNYQPFQDQNSNKKEQYLCILKNPLIANLSQIKGLSSEAKVIGDEYLNDNKIKENLIQSFINKVIPQLNKPIGIYDGMGITENDIDQILDLYKKAAIKLAKGWFHKYKSLNFEKPRQDYIDNMEGNKEAHPLAYEHFIELVNNEKNKYK